MFSFYRPSLQGGKHTVSVEQSIEAPGGEPDDTVKPVKDSQELYVVAPQYNISPEIVDSVYPPPAEGTEARTLPHIVFKDPHLPWENSVNGANDKNDTRNKVPWVALLTFEGDEIQLSDADATRYLPSGTDLKLSRTETHSYRMKANNLPGITNAQLTMPAPSARLKDENTEVIFVKTDLFTHLFSDGKNAIDVSRYKYLSHVRKVATAGMVAEEKGEVGMYSLAVSHRTGPISVNRPTPVHAHLVAIHHIGNPKVLQLPVSKDRVALVSLYSWTYNSYPPDAFNVARSLKSLGDKLRDNYGMLQPPEMKSTQGEKPSPEEERLQQIITKRRDDGFNLIRHRTVTGEITAAMIRSPLTPTPVPAGLGSDFQMTSNFGTDLQILDPELSLMDITYTSAWQLGKVLALGDQAFTAALARLRNAIHSGAVKAAKQEVHTELDCYSSREDLVSNIVGLVKGLNDVNKNIDENEFAAVSTNRWKRAEVLETADISMRSSHIAPRLYSHAVSSAMVFASSPDGGLYNEHNIPTNTDYAHILEWVVDKIHFANIPAHYLIPDASYLEEESLRFFYVDPNWTDAMIDGALSLANHWADSPGEDYGRKAIKEALNKYITTLDPALNIRPQMPQYGFLMRSRILVQFPDIAVSAKFGEKPKSLKNENEKPKAPILIQRKLAPDTMLCLFDCAPKELRSLAFTMPAHQQFFAVGKTMDKDSVDIAFKRIYTTSNDKPEKRRSPIDTISFQKCGEMFDMEWRTVKVESYVKKVFQTLQAAMKGDFTDTAPTSTLLALQLNEPIYVLDIMIPEDRPFAQTTRPSILQLSVPRSVWDGVKPKKIQRPQSNKRPTFVRIDRPCAVQSPPHLSLKLMHHPEWPEWPIITEYRPTFEFKVYPLRNPDFIPTDSDYYFDLIFSIRLKTGKINKNLKNIRVEVPRGAMDSDIPSPKEPEKNKPRKYTKPLLDQDYYPPPPTMLSNLRFNVIKGWSSNKEHLVLDIVPRSPEGVPLSKVREASFVLGRVKVCPWPSKEKAYISCKSIYWDYPDQGWDDGRDFVMMPSKSD